MIVKGRSCVDVKDCLFLVLSPHAKMTCAGVLSSPSQVVRYAVAQKRVETVTLASSMAFCGSVILGNAYIEPATSLHLTLSSEFRISVVNFAFFLKESRMDVLS